MITRCPLYYAAAHTGSRLVTIIKKYSNRRLYDTQQSKYITLDELAAKIREGDEVRVVDAKTGDDLTQPTLTQLILESPTARLLPVGLLHRLLRMQDDAIAEFFSSYVTWALDMYLAARGSGQQLASMLPFGGAPWAAANPLARLFGGGPFGGPAAPAPTAGPPQPAPAEPESSAQATNSDEIRQLREELEELKRAMTNST